jgi:hypothetical protein
MVGEYHVGVRMWKPTLHNGEWCVEYTLTGQRICLSPATAHVPPTMERAACVADALNRVYTGRNAAGETLCYPYGVVYHSSNATDMRTHVE